MRKFYILLSCLFLGANLMAQFGQGSMWFYRDGFDSTNVDTGAVLRLTDDAPDVEDEEIDDEWATAAWHVAEYERRSGSDDMEAVSFTDGHMRWKGLYDETGVFALIEILDDELDNDNEGWWEQDGVEVYITLDLTGATGRNESPNSWFVLAHGADSIENTNAYTKMDETANYEGYDPIITKWLVEGDGDAPDTVFYEMFLPILALPNDAGFELVEGNKFLMTFQVNDADGGARQNIYSWADSTDGWNGTNNWPVIELGDDESQVTSVKENKIENTLTVYPNPASDIVTLSKVANIEIYNISGQLEISKTNTNKVDISALQTGVYFIKAENEVVKLVVK